jgi:hypothetical protein
VETTWKTSDDSKGDAVTPCTKVHTGALLAILLWREETLTGGGDGEPESDFAIPPCKIVSQRRRIRYTYALKILRHVAEPWKYKW